MPVRDTIDPSVTDQEVAVAEALLEHVALAREITVARAGKRAPVIRRLEVELDEGEDAKALARDAARSALEIAENDADGNRRRYHIAILGKAPSNTKRPATLATVSVVVSGDGDDDEAPASTTRAAGKLMSDMGDRFLRMQDATVNMVERLHPLTTQTEMASAERVRAQGETDVALTKLKIAEKERTENLKLLLELAPVVLPFARVIGDAIVEAIRAKAASYGKRDAS